MQYYVSSTMINILHATLYLIFRTLYPLLLLFSTLAPNLGLSFHTHFFLTSPHMQFSEMSWRFYLRQIVCLQSLCFPFLDHHNLMLTLQEQTSHWVSSLQCLLHSSPVSTSSKMVLKCKWNRVNTLLKILLWLPITMKKKPILHIRAFNSCLLCPPLRSPVPLSLHVAVFL